MDRSRRVGASLAGGVVLTLLSAVVPFQSLLGRTHYGFPMAWLIRRVLAPEYVPWRVNWLGLVVDVAVWTAVVFVGLVLYDRVRQRPPDGDSPV